ncbi:hypothetical protein RHGRI_029110 [Rhododendron griersonianum]|uniref:Uncharacterized protein n=1 Tax=Rhododendron griersonianum TaxID=479676 RepID=A0AAV6II35_9ERIC|nr:hypothetical protein RHGRI_029110 [Rhododendron griersonianum]
MVKERRGVCGSMVREMRGGCGSMVRLKWAATVAHLKGKGIGCTHTILREKGVTRTLLTAKGGSPTMFSACVFTTNFLSVFVSNRVALTICSSPVVIVGSQSSTTICTHTKLPLRSRSALQVRNQRGVMPEFLRLTGIGDGRRNWWVEETWVLWRVGEEDRRGVMPAEASERDLDALAVEKSPN